MSRSASFRAVRSSSLGLHHTQCGAAIYPASESVTLAEASRLDRIVAEKDWLRASFLGIRKTTDAKLSSASLLGRPFSLAISNHTYVSVVDTIVLISLGTVLNTLTCIMQCFILELVPCHSATGESITCAGPGNALACLADMWRLKPLSL